MTTTATKVDRERAIYDEGKLAAFVQAVGRGLTLMEAYNLVGLDPRQVQASRCVNPEFAAALEEALERGGTHEERVAGVVPEHLREPEAPATVYLLPHVVAAGKVTAGARVLADREGQARFVQVVDVEGAADGQVVLVAREGRFEVPEGRGLLVSVDEGGE